MRRTAEKETVKTAGSSKKKIIIISALILLIAAMVAVYALWISPMSVEEAGEVPELLEGETLGSGNKIFIYEPYDRADIESISVSNPLGSYTLCRNSSDDSFYLENNKSTQLNSSLLTVSLVPVVRYPLSTQRIVTECDSLEKYGLDEASRAKVVMKTADGKESVLYVGNALVNGGGYYCMTDGRSAVYQLDDGGQFKKSVLSIVSPSLSLPLGDDYYTLPHFELWSHGEITAVINYMNEEQRKASATPSTSYYEMTEPGNFVPSTSNITTLYENFKDFSGTEVLEMSEDVKENLPTEVLEKYGLASPAYVIRYTYSGVDNIIFVSEQNPDGSYYAYSLLFSIVARVDASKLAFLSWELTDYIDRPVFQKNINDISKMEFSSADISETFSLQYKNETLSVTPSSTKKPLGENSLTTFKELYAALLTIGYEESADSTSTDSLLLSLKITTAAGIEFEYKFYTVSSRRCYYTVNGDGAFTVVRDDVTDLIDRLTALMSGKTTD